MRRGEIRQARQTRLVAQRFPDHRTPTSATARASCFRVRRFGTAPQGSILGPLFFLIHLNDINNNICHGKLRLFADDTTVFYDAYDVNEIEHKIQSDLDKLNVWFRVNKLTVNAAKCNYIVIKNPAKIVPDLNIYIQDEHILRYEKIKYLGVYIDQHLTFKPHIEYLCKKISPIVGMLSKVRWSLPKNICVMLYNSLVHSKLAYCIDSWGSASDTALSPLEKIQKKAIRFISHSDYLAHTLPLFQQLRIYTLRNLYFSKICLLVFKKLNGLNNSIHCNFSYVNHGYGTRSTTNHLLKLPETSGGIMSNSLLRTLSYVGPHFYNSLPTMVKNADSVSIFKNSLKRWLVSANIQVYKLMYTHKK